jgi:hypothetical protein
MSWRKQEAVLTLPKSVVKLGEKTIVLLEAAQALATVLKSALSILSGLTFIELTASQLIIKTAVANLEALIADLTKDAGVYVLMVPPARRVVLAQVVQDALQRLSLTSMPQPDITLGELSLSRNLSANAAKFVQAAAYAQGGNPGFLRLVSESILDEGDPNRPLFGVNDYVAGYFVLAGAKTEFDLASTLAHFRALFGPLAHSNVFVDTSLPSSRNLSVNVVPRGGDYAVRLAWRPQIALGSSSSGEAYLIRRVYVIRSEDASLLDTRDTIDIFGTWPSKGLKGLGGAEVIDAVDIDPYHWDAPITEYYDTATLEKGKDYYYAIIFEFEVGARSDLLLRNTDKIMARLGPLSSVQRVTYTDVVVLSALSQAPDWTRTPSLLGLVPALRATIMEKLAYVEAWGGTVTTYGELLKSYVAWIDREIQAYGALIERTRFINGLLSLLTTPLSGGVYVRGFETTSSDVAASRGGTQFMLEELAESLSGAPDAPPYNDGDEYVTGVVFLMGGPSKAAFASTQAALDLLLNAGSAQGQVVTAAIKEIDRILSEARTISLGSNLESLVADPPPSDDGRRPPGYTPVPAPPQETTLPTVPPVMPPIGSADKGNCPLVKKPSTPTVISFGADLRAS